MNEFKLWVDKYKPCKLDNFTFNKTASRQFTALAKKTNIPHLIVKGVSGIGKKSMVMSYIQRSLENYGLNEHTNIFNTHNIIIPLKYPSKSIDLHVQKSLYHYNVNPSDYNIYDRHIVQDFLKHQFKFKNLTGFPYKYVIIRNAEKLSDDAQQSLRRTLESRIHNCRFIFMIDSENRGGLIPPLNSRCIHIRMSAPTKEEALDVVFNILEKEGFQNVNEKLICHLYRKCQHNLTRTINTLNLLAVKSPNLLKESVINFPNIDPVASKLHEIIQLFNAQTFQSIVQIRSILYVLLAHGVSPEKIIKRLFRILIYNLKGYESVIIEMTSDIEAMLNKSSREFYHLENYIIGLMALVKNYKPNKGPPKEKVTLNLIEHKSSKKENDKNTNKNIKDIKDNKDLKDKKKIVKPKITIKPINESSPKNIKPNKESSEKNSPKSKKIQLKKKPKEPTLNLSQK